MHVHMMQRKRQGIVENRHADADEERERERDGDGDEAGESDRTIREEEASC